jgi:hypothetical protein
MKINNFFCRWRIVALLFAGIFPVRVLHAQPEQDSGGRFLLIFETSSDMKKREPSVEEAVNQILAFSVNGELHDGDTVGVWTFGDNVHAGEFPLQDWKSENAETVIGNIAAFVERQRYAKVGRFDVVLPLLNRIVKDSERLTVLIFCDGEEEVHGTPFDVGINQVFKQHLRERKKSKQPFILVFRSQLGEYAGCTVSFPPAQVNLPEFPPLPEPTNTPTQIAREAPPQAEPLQPAPIQMPQAAPLIMIGNEHTTNIPDFISQETTPEPSLTTNTALVISNAPQTFLIRTNYVATSSANPAGGNHGALIFGLGLLMAAGILVIVMRQRLRDDSHSSLITRSIDDGKNTPPKN